MILNIIFLGCATSSKINSIGADGFPDIWWQAVPEDQLPEWEIPPQAADRSKGEVILSKRYELGQFSNLQASAFDLDGEHYESLEGLWQSMKYPEGPNDERLKDSSVVWVYTRDQVKKLTGFEAKKAGDLASANMKKLAIKWVTYKGKKLDYSEGDTSPHYELIVRASRAKLAAHPELVQLLLRTKNLKFLPDHKQKADSPPSYHYHEIYMKLRNELQDLKK